MSNLTPESVDKIFDDDRAFFNSNPLREYRVRRAIGSEWSSAGSDANYTVVRVIRFKDKPSLRFRIAVHSSRPIDNTDAMGASIWQMFEHGVPA